MEFYLTGNISAVTFTVKNIDETSVLVNITDPLTSIHLQGKQLTIRDILKKDLKYKISYYKSGSTGKVMCSTFQYLNNYIIYQAADTTLNFFNLEIRGCLLYVYLDCFLVFCVCIVLLSLPLSSLPSSPVFFACLNPSYLLLSSWCI